MSNDVLNFVVAGDNGGGAPASDAFKGMSDDLNAFKTASENVGNTVQQNFQKTGVSAKELKEAVHLAGKGMGGDVGQMVQLAQYLPNPWMFAIAGIVNALHMLQEEYQNTLEQTKTVVSMMDHDASNALHAEAEAAIHAAAAMDDFHRALEAHGTEEDDATEAMRARIATFNEHISGLTAIAEAQERANEAVTDAAVATGQLSEVEARRKKFDSQDSLTQQQRSLEAQKTGQEIAQKTARIEQAKIDRDTNFSKADQLEEDAEPAKAAAAAATKKAAQEAGLEKKLQDQLADTKAKLAVLRAHPDLSAAGGTLGVGPQAGTAFNSLEDQESDQTAALKTQQQAALGFADTAARLEEKAKKKQADINLTRRKANDAEALGLQLNSEVAQMHKVEAERKKSFAAIDAARQQQEQAEMQQLTAKYMGQVAHNFGTTNLEKMGFVFGKGGPTLLSDHAKRTADATTAIARHTAIIAQRLTSPDAANGVRGLLINAIC